MRYRPINNAYSIVHPASTDPLTTILCDAITIYSDTQQLENLLVHSVLLIEHNKSFWMGLTEQLEQALPQPFSPTTEKPNDTKKNAKRRQHSIIM